MKPASASTGWYAPPRGSGDADRRTVLVTAHVHDVHAEETTALARDRLEDLARSDALGDERGHLPQRRLLVREDADLVPRAGVGDRGRHQLREVLEA
jgi:hypothetical protein